MRDSRVRGRFPVVSLLACAAALAIACNRDATTTTDSTVATDDTAVTQDERTEVIADLRQRISELEREYSEATQEVASGEAAATAGLREELKEDMQNVREAVDSLSTTTAENWWDRHEDAVEQTMEDIETDVRRLAGSIPEPAREAEATTGAAGAPFESRRDAFVDTMRARVDAMERALANVDAKGVTETELEDTRARVQKLGEDIDRLRTASPDDWWELSETRVTEYVARVEDSIGRLDDNEPNAP